MTAPTHARETAGTPAIRTAGLTRRYRTALRTITAVDALDLTVPAGASFGLLGPNGAGKTTTIQMVLGLVAPTSGTSEVFGMPIADHDARRLVGFVPEKFQLPRAWTAREYVDLHAGLHGLRGRERRVAVDDALERTGIANRAGDRLSGFSKGMQQRAAIAQAIVGSPRLLILDEPTSALDPLGRLQVRDLVRELGADGATIIFNSHILAEVEAICDQVAIMRDGRVLHQGPVAQLASDDGVLARLRLGGEARQVSATIEACPSHARLDDLRHVGELVEVDVWLPSPAEVSIVVRSLVEAQVDVFEVAQRREGLESLFVRLVGDHPTEEAA